MKGTATDVLKSIPDFEEFMQLARDIAKLLYEKMVLEARIKDGESKVFREASSRAEFMQNGKPPTTAFIDNTFKYPGLNGELLPLRLELAKVSAILEEKKLQMDIYKSMLDVWRTLSSNERSSSL